MPLPTHTKPPADTTGGQSYSIEMDIAKRLTPDLGLTARYSWNYFQPRGMPSFHGFGGLSTGAQYQLFINGQHQFMGLLGLDVDPGHPGAVHHGRAADHPTLSPT